MTPFILVWQVWSRVTRQTRLVFFLKRKKKKRENGRMARMGNWGENREMRIIWKVKTYEKLKTQRIKIQNSEKTNKIEKVRKVKENPSFFFLDFSFSLADDAESPPFSSPSASPSRRARRSLSLSSLCSPCCVRYRRVCQYVSWFPFLIFYSLIIVICGYKIIIW
jgi:hypothetical protein